MPGEYKLILLDKEGKEIFSDLFIVKQSFEKKLWIFPIWKMEEENLLAEDVHFVVPKGARLLIDGEEINSKLFISDTDETMSYYAEYLFTGNHDIKVTKQYYKDMEQLVQIDSTKAKNQDIVLELELEPDMVWRKDYYDFLTAVANNDVETLETRFPETVDVIQELLESRKDEQIELRFVTPSLNEDKIPEIIIGCGSNFTPDTYGKLFAYDNQKIQPIELELEYLEYFGGSPCIPLNWTYINEQKRVLVCGSPRFIAGCDISLDIYNFDGKGMTLSESIVCSEAQLYIQRGEEEDIFGEGGYPLDDRDELKSTINGKEVDPETAYEKINEYKADETAIWDKAVNITPENLEEILEFSY